MLRLAVFVFALGGLLSSAALAQKSPARKSPARAEAPADEPAPEIRYKKRTSHTFGEAYVDGTIRGPQGTVIKIRPQAKFTPRIPVRTEFRREMMGSVGSL